MASVDGFASTYSSHTEPDQQVSYSQFQKDATECIKNAVGVGDL